MLLVIHNIPNHMRLSDVKAMIEDQCGLSEIILDKFDSEGNNKRVTVGLADEADAALLVRKINGLYVHGCQLYVEDVRQKKAAEQPYRPMNSLQVSNNRQQAPIYGRRDVPAMSEPTSMTPARLAYSNLPFYMSPVQSSYSSHDNQAPQVPNHPRPPTQQQAFYQNQYPQPVVQKRWDVQPAYANFPTQSHRGSVADPGPSQGREPQWGERRDASPSPERPEPIQSDWRDRDRTESSRSERGYRRSSDREQGRSANFRNSHSDKSRRNEFDRTPKHDRQDRSPYRSRDEGNGSHRNDDARRQHSSYVERSPPRDRDFRGSRRGDDRQYIDDRGRSNDQSDRRERGSDYRRGADKPRDHDRYESRDSRRGDQGYEQRSSARKRPYSDISSSNKSNKYTDDKWGKEKVGERDYDRKESPKRSRSNREKDNAGPPKVDYSKLDRAAQAPQNDSQLKDMVTKHNGWRYQIASTLANEVIASRNKVNQGRLVNYQAIVKKLKECIVSRIDVLLGDRIVSNIKEMKDSYRLKFPPEEDILFFSAVMDKIKRDRDGGSEDDSENDASPAKTGAMPPPAQPSKLPSAANPRPTVPPVQNKPMPPISFQIRAPTPAPPFRSRASNPTQLQPAAPPQPRVVNPTPQYNVNPPNPNPYYQNLVQNVPRFANRAPTYPQHQNTAPTYPQFQNTTPTYPQFQNTAPAAPQFQNRAPTPQFQNRAPTPQFQNKAPTAPQFHNNQSSASTSNPTVNFRAPVPSTQQAKPAKQPPAKPKDKPTPSQPTVFTTKKGIPVFNIKVMQNNPVFAKKQINKSKQLHRMEFRDEVQYETDPLVKQAIEDEIDAMLELYKTRPEKYMKKCDFRVHKKIVNETSALFKKVMSLNLTKRILNISTGLVLRVFPTTSSKFPNPEAFRQFMSKRGVVNIKKCPKMYVITCANFNAYDALAAADIIDVEGVPMSIKVMHVAGPRVSVREKMREARFRGMATQQNEDDDMGEDVTSENIGNTNEDMDNTNDDIDNVEQKQTEQDDVIIVEKNTEVINIEDDDKAKGDQQISNPPRPEFYLDPNIYHNAVTPEQKIMRNKVGALHKVARKTRLEKDWEAYNKARLEYIQLKLSDHTATVLTTTKKADRPPATAKQELRKKMKMAFKKAKKTELPKDWLAYNKAKLDFNLWSVTDAVHTTMTEADTPLSPTRQELINVKYIALKRAKKSKLPQDWAAYNKAKLELQSRTLAAEGASSSATQADNGPADKDKNNVESSEKQRDTFELNTEKVSETTEHNDCTLEKETVTADGNDKTLEKEETTEQNNEAQKDVTMEQNVATSEAQDNLIEQNVATSESQEDVTELNIATSEAQDNVTEQNVATSGAQDVIEQNFATSETQENVTEQNIATSEAQNNVMEQNVETFEVKEDVIEQNVATSEAQENVIEQNVATSEAQENVIEQNVATSEAQENVIEQNVATSEAQTDVIEQKTTNQVESLVNDSTKKNEATLENEDETAKNAKVLETSQTEYEAEDNLKSNAIGDIDDDDLEDF